MCLSKKTRTAIVNWMDEHEFSRADLARALETSPQHITNVLNGHAAISMTMADRIIKKLGCSIKIELE